MCSANHGVKSDASLGHPLRKGTLLFSRDHRRTSLPINKRTVPQQHIGAKRSQSPRTDRKTSTRPDPAGKFHPELQRQCWRLWPHPHKQPKLAGAPLLLLLVTLVCFLLPFRIRTAAEWEFPPPIPGGDVGCLGEAAGLLWIHASMSPRNHPTAQDVLPPKGTGYAGPAETPQSRARQTISNHDRGHAQHQRQPTRRHVRFTVNKDEPPREQSEQDVLCFMPPTRQQRTLERSRTVRPEPLPCGVG